MTPLDVLEGHVPAGVVDGLRAVGIPNLEMARRMSAAEAARIPGVGPAGSASLAAFLRGRGMRWGG